jgi:hypothetical protein
MLSTERVREAAVFRTWICKVGYVDKITGAPKGGGGVPGCKPPQTNQNRNLKNKDFVDIMISNVLRDFPFSRNQPLKLEFWKIN